MLICKKELGVDSFQLVLNSFTEFREKNKYSSYGLANFETILNSEDFQKVKSNVITIPSLVPLITGSLYGNPRQIKRFLNTYTIRKRLAKVASIENFEDAILAKLMILEYSEPKLFTQIFGWQANQDGIPNEIIDLENICKDKELSVLLSELTESKFKDWNRPKIIKWLQVDPLLSNVDLRDYFWIARDKLNDSISASSLVPPIVKSLFNELQPDQMTSAVTKKIIENKFIELGNIEREAFLTLLSNSLKRNPTHRRNYEIFNELLELKIQDSPAYYIGSLKVISDSNIDAAIGLRLKNYKSHPEMGEFLSEYFTGKTSKAAKAFNLK